MCLILGMALKSNRTGGKLLLELGKGCLFEARQKRCVDRFED